MESDFFFPHKIIKLEQPHLVLITEIKILIYQLCCCLFIKLGPHMALCILLSRSLSNIENGRDTARKTSMAQSGFAQACSSKNQNGV